MDIPNLNPNPVATFNAPLNTSKSLSKPALIIIAILAVSLGFWGSRVPSSSPPVLKDSALQNKNTLIANPETLTEQSQIEVNKLYGNTSKAFTDSATGTLEKGSINGEGTHILNRPGGSTQRAALTSSVIDLDLFVGKKVEIKGQTNASTKTSWLIDVGTIKIVE